MNPLPRIGVLSLQGSVRSHFAHLEACGATPVEVKLAPDLDSIDGLILPGGESTTMLKLIDVFALKPALLAAAERIPFWGICAGSILMARKVHHPEQSSLNLFDCEIERNGYGRQMQSESLRLRNYEVALIRAPRITRLSAKAEVIESRGDDVLMARSRIGRNFHQISSFHAELNPQLPSPFHRDFVDEIVRRQSVAN